MGSRKLTDEELILIISRKIRKSYCSTKKLQLQDIRNFCEKYGKDALPKYEILDHITSRLLHHLNPCQISRNDPKPSNIKDIHLKYKNLQMENKHIGVVDKMNAPLKKTEFCSSYNIVLKKKFPKIDSQKQPQNKNICYGEKLRTNISVQSSLNVLNIYSENDCQKQPQNKNICYEEKLGTNISVQSSLNVLNIYSEKERQNEIPTKTKYVSSSKLQGKRSETEPKPLNRKNTKNDRQNEIPTKTKNVSSSKLQGKRSLSEIEPKPRNRKNKKVKAILKGVVKNSEQEPLAGAKIEVFANFNSQGVTKTLITGEYEIELVLGKRKNYTITVSLENYVKQTKNLTIKNQKFQDKNFILQPQKMGRRRVVETFPQTREDLLKLKFTEEDVDNALKRFKNNVEFAFYHLTSSDKKF